MIVYTDPTGKRSDLYVIQDAFSDSLSDPTRIGQAASAQVVEYTCNEGIPLVLTFENIGDDSFVTWSHDGFAGNRLPNVISASGVKYSDGKNTVWTKGREVFVNLDGIEDTCTETN